MVLIAKLSIVESYKNSSHGKQKLWNFLDYGPKMY